MVIKVDQGLALMPLYKRKQFEGCSSNLAEGIQCVGWAEMVLRSWPAVSNSILFLLCRMLGAALAGRARGEEYATSVPLRITFSCYISENKCATVL
jgi:hypothetical protein